MYNIYPVPDPSTFYCETLLLCSKILLNFCQSFCFCVCLQFRKPWYATFLDKLWVSQTYGVLKSTQSHLGHYIRDGPWLTEVAKPVWFYSWQRSSMLLSEMVLFSYHLDWGLWRDLSWMKAPEDKSVLPIWVKLLRCLTICFCACLEVMIRSGYPPAAAQETSVCSVFQSSLWG